MCDFNARAMLDLRRQVANNPSMDQIAAATLIKSIDEQRWKHFEETGCCCWDEEIEAAKVAA